MKNIRLILRGPLFALLGVVLISGCGYHIAGKGGKGESTGFFLVKEVKSISIPFFTNETYRADIESVITTAMVNEFMNSIEVVKNDKAEAIMIGVVKSYKLKPVSYGKRDVTREYRLHIALSVKLVRKADNKVLWQDTSITDYDDFSVDASDIAGTKFAEREALKKMARDTARLIKERMMEGF